MIEKDQLTSLHQVGDIYDLVMSNRTHEVARLIEEKGYSVSRLYEALIEFPDAFQPEAYKKMRDLIELKVSALKSSGQSKFPPYSLFNLVRAGKENEIKHPHLQVDGKWTGRPRDFVIWLNNIYHFLTDINKGADALKIVKAHNIPISKTTFYELWEEKFNI